VHTLHLRGSVSVPALTETQQTTRVLGLGQRTRHLPRPIPPEQPPSVRALLSTLSMTRGLRGVALLQEVRCSEKCDLPTTQPWSALLPSKPLHGRGFVERLPASRPLSGGTAQIAAAPRGVDPGGRAVVGQATFHAPMQAARSWRWQNCYCHRKH
jgi:hypothetical protein